MLLYEYPPKLDRIQRQRKAMHDIKEHKKMQKNMYKNLILAGIIVGISFLVSVVFIKVLLIAIGIGNAVVAYLLYMYSALARDTDCYTKIYDDHLEHRQMNNFNKSHTTFNIGFDDISKSYQTSSGKLVIELLEENNCIIEREKIDKRSENEFKGNKVTLNFQDTKAKLYLIEKLYGEIKYPKKNYNVIEDDEDEDDKWDSLQKHGL